MNHKLFLRMKTLSRNDVRNTYVNYLRSENSRIDKGRAAMVEIGYERTDCADKITSDGREVIDIYGQKWALRPDVHAERLAQLFEAAKQRQVDQETKEPETKSVAGTESLSAMICPKCGDALQHTVVCPSCAAGKIGYRHRYVCVCGGVDIISKEAL